MLCRLICVAPLISRNWVHSCLTTLAPRRASNLLLSHTPTSQATQIARDPSWFQKAAVFSFLLQWLWSQEALQGTPCAFYKKTVISLRLQSLRNAWGIKGLDTVWLWSEIWCLFLEENRTPNSQPIMWSVSISGKTSLKFIITIGSLECPWNLLDSTLELVRWELRVKKRF